MTTPNGSGSTGAPRRTWTDIIVDCLIALRGKTVSTETIYESVVRHPDAIARAMSGKRMRTKLRHVLQRLRDLGAVETRGPGHWHIR